MLKVLLYASLVLPTALAEADSFSFTVSPGFADVMPDTVTGYDGSRYTRLRCDGCAYLSETGTPDIPYRIYEIEVPTYSNNFAIRTVSSSAGDKVLLDAPVWPHQPPVSLNDNPADFFTPLTREALAASRQPQPIVFDDGFEQGRIHTVRIGVPMCSYGDSAMSLTPYSVLNLQLDYQPCSAEEMCHRPLGLQQVISECTLRGMTGGMSATGHNHMKGGSAGATLEESGFGYYYIITPGEFEKDLDMLVALKRSKGLDVRVHCIEDIVASTSGCDDAERLREWLRIELEDKIGRSHVLLIGGNKTNMPIRKFRTFGDPNDNRPFDDNSYMPSDAYFSDLTTEYKLDPGRDGVNYSCHLGNPSTTYRPCVPVGRLIVSNSKEIDNYVSKLLDYELYPGHGDPSYLGRGFINRQIDAVKDSDESIFDSMGFNGVITRFDDNGLSTFEDSEITGERVIAEVSKSGISSLQGHGAPMFIGVTGGNDKWEWHYIKASDGIFDYNIGDVPNVINTHGRTVLHQYEYNNSFDVIKGCHSPGILYSLACHTVPLDTYAEDGGKYNIGSAYTSAGLFGGVAYIGNTRSGYFGASSRIEKRFGELINTTRSIGQSHIESLNKTANKHCQFTNILAGDPEFHVWTGVPLNIPVSCTATQDNVTLTASVLRQAQISLSNGADWSDTFIPTSETVTINSEDFSFGNSTGESGCCGQVFVAIRGYIPYSKLIVRNAHINSKRIFILNDSLVLNGHMGERLDISNRGDITFKCMKDISMSDALKINNGGQASLISNGNISLGSTTIDNGGILKAEGTSVVMLPGFSVEKGGLLEIKNAE